MTDDVISSLQPLQWPCVSLRMTCQRRRRCGFWRPRRASCTIHVCDGCRLEVHFVTHGSHHAVYGGCWGHGRAACMRRRSTPAVALRLAHSIAVHSTPATHGCVYMHVRALCVVCTHACMYVCLMCAYCGDQDGKRGSVHVPGRARLYPNRSSSGSMAAVIVAHAAGCLTMGECAGSAVHRQQ